MRKPPRCLILFHRPDFGLDQAQALLSERGLTVTRKDDVLAVSWHDGPVLSITMARGKQVRQEARSLGRSSVYYAKLSTYDAKAEITFTSLDEVLDEINTLIEVQATLQDATGGVMYNSWNRHWSMNNEQ